MKKGACPVRQNTADGTCAAAGGKTFLEGDLSGQVGVEDIADLRRVLGLAQGPHELGHRGFRGHVAAGDYPALQQALAYLVDGQVAGLYRQEFNILKDFTLL